MRDNLRRLYEKRRCPYCGRNINPLNYDDFHKNAKCTKIVRTTVRLEEKPLTINQIMLQYGMQPTQQTLDEAIKGVVEVFLSEEESFSIYGVTLSLRDLINQGWIRINGLVDTYKPIDLEDPTSDEVKTQDLPHWLVREAFNRLFNNSELYCDILSRGKYTTYGPVPVATTGYSAPQYSTTGTPPSTPYPQTYTCPAPSSQVTVSVDDFTDKIITYLSNKGEATLKQIQSRLKTRGITCQNLEDALTKVSEVALIAKDDLSKVIAKLK